MLLRHLEVGDMAKERPYDFSCGTKKCLVIQRSKIPLLWKWSFMGWLYFYSKAILSISLNCIQTEIIPINLVEWCKYVKLKVQKISISYRTVPSTIWSIFSEFLIFCRLIKKKNMRNEENIGHIVRDKRAITSLSLT